MNIVANRYRVANYHIFGKFPNVLSRVLGLSSYLTLRDSRDGRPPDSSVHGIFQGGIREWVAISSTRGLPDPGAKPEPPASPALSGGFFTTEPHGSPRFPEKWPWKSTCPLVSELFSVLTYYIDKRDDGNGSVRKMSHSIQCSLGNIFCLVKCLSVDSLQLLFSN